MPKIPMLRCIYEIYSRGASQGGDGARSSRKVRLKFDEYNITAGNRTASLYDVPDIIGLTIVVAYPSDINVVGPSGRRRRVRAPGTAAGAPSCRRALSSLAYFHADGFDRREKSEESREKCVEFYRAASHYEELGLPPYGVETDRIAMEAALKDGDLGPIAFEAYDNEAFVGIQTAWTEEELRAARDLLISCTRRARLQTAIAPTLCWNFTIIARGCDWQNSRPLCRLRSFQFG